MTRWLRDFRLMPVVLIAIVCLFALKTFGLISDGGYTLGQRLGSGDTLVVTTVPDDAGAATAFAGGAAARSLGAQPQEVLDAGDVQLSRRRHHRIDPTHRSLPKAGQEKAESRASAAAESRPESKAAAGTSIAHDQPRSASAGERALLERLQERRQELDARARELDLRESMLKAAEKKLETQTAVEKARRREAAVPRLGQWPSARKRKRPRTPASRASSPCTRP